MKNTTRGSQNTRFSTARMGKSSPIISIPRNSLLMKMERILQ